jgi:Flp pilus assembly protein TadD
MKNTLLICSLLIGFIVARGQSLDQGNTHLYYERAISAENTFHQLLKQDPDNGMAWLGLDKAYVLNDSLSKAADTLRLAPVSVQTDPYFIVAMGYILLQQNKKEEAAKYFDQALSDTRGKDGDILSAIADAHIDAKEGDANYAIEQIQKALKKDKKNAALYVKLGDAYRKLNNGDDAFTAYQKAIDKNDKYALAYHRMGKIFVTQNNPEIYLKYFRNAVAADQGFAPSLYMLYAYEFNHDPVASMAYYNEYLKNADYSIKNEYELTDLLYTNKQYHQAILKANSLLQRNSENIKPRLYKLLAYSYASLMDTSKALLAMKSYFNKEADSNFVAKDFFVMADYYASMPGNDSLVVNYLEKGSELDKDSTTLFKYYKKLADRAAVNKDYLHQAKWLAKYYPGNQKASNLDLFNWGLANYLSADYKNADSVFGLYVIKYPEQSFGYYWQAKANAMLDSTMAEGLAVPSYKKLIDVLLNDTTNAQFKKWIVEAYEYLAAYEANIKKDYAASVTYFKKILEVEPDNENANKYIKILGKDLVDKNN